MTKPSECVFLDVPIKLEDLISCGVVRFGAGIVSGLRMTDVFLRFK